MNRIQQLDLLKNQDGKCKICEKEIRLFNGAKGGFIDHCHKTGTVRGILCNRCNTIVGGIENLNDVNKLLSYLNNGV